MNKSGLFAIFLLVFMSCNKNLNESAQNMAVPNDTFKTQNPIDSIALTIDALRNLPVKKDYKVLGNVNTLILTYCGFTKDDMTHYNFVDAKKNNYDFSKNNTNFTLIVPTDDYTESNGRFRPNGKYLNKKFQVFWRTIQLNRRPKNEMEYYYETYDEIIYLKQLK